jgi:hypothetical protein
MEIMYSRASLALINAMHLERVNKKRYMKHVSCYATLFGRALNWLREQLGYETDKELANRIVIAHAVSLARKEALTETDVICIKEKAQRLFDKHFNLIAENQPIKRSDLEDLRDAVGRRTFEARRREVEKALGRHFLGSHDLIWAMTYCTFQSLSTKVANRVDLETLAWLQEKVEERQRYRPLPKLPKCINQ